MDNILPISGAVSCTDNIDNVSIVKVGITEIIGSDSSFWTLLEPLLIAFIIHADKLYVMQTFVF